MKYQYIETRDECDYISPNLLKTHIKKETAKALNDAMDEAFEKLCEVLGILNGEKDCDSLNNFLLCETDFIASIEGVLNGIRHLKSYNYDDILSTQLYECGNIYNFEGEIDGGSPNGNNRSF